MPTNFPRISVVQNEELREAMAKGERFLPDRSKAALLRDLAIRGADAIRDEANISPGLKRILELPGVKPPTEDFREFLANHVPAPMPEEADPYAATKALQEQREERM